MDEQKTTYKYGKTYHIQWPKRLALHYKTDTCT